MARCPACLAPFPMGDLEGVATHLCAQADLSDVNHVRWLNQHVGRTKVDAAHLSGTLRELFDLKSGLMKSWIKQRFIRKFYGKIPHPFVLALQHPTRSVLVGYVIEHQHFLRQWVRSCAYIMARTDQSDVVLYELDNLNTEFGGRGPGRVAHYELLLQMGE